MTTPDLTTIALQTAHYRAVQSRLYGPRVSRAIPIPPKVELPSTAPLRAVKSVRDAILTLRSATRRPFVRDANDRIQLKDLAHIAMTVMEVSSVDFFSLGRFTAYVEARQLYYWLAWNYTTASSPNIGRHCKLRHYSTVLHGINKINKSLKTYGHDSKWQSRIDACLAEMGK